MIIRVSLRGWLIPAVCLVIGCSTYRADYDIGLTSVDRPAEIQKKYGSYDVTKVKEVGSDISSFEDGLVRIVWTPSAYDAVFILTNKTNQPIKILWDNAVFVDEDGTNHRVVHGDVNHTEASEFQKPALIEPNGTYKDAIFPAGSFVYRSGNWHKKPLFPTISVSRQANSMEEEASEYVGKSFQIILPLEVDNAAHEYIFTFKVSNVEVN
jgi:hypothetical protein